MPFAKLNKENVAKVPRTSGLYYIRNARGTAIYVGSSKRGKTGNLRHRLQSYYQEDDFRVNKTKRPLRKHAKKFSYHCMPIKKARELEKKKKRNMRFNVL
jgi:excinuclease UvrABC nuclease subunit